MYKKDSKRHSIDRPQLVMHYVGACRNVYGSAPFVHAKLFPKFSVFEDDLRDAGYSTKEYSVTIIMVMKPFVEKKGWKYLPVTMFLGDYCLKRYAKIASTSTVRISGVDVTEILYNDELMVARMFIDRNVNSDGSYVRLADVVCELKSLLSKEWLQVYKSRGKRPEMDVIEQLIEEYRISKPVVSYLDIVSALR